MKQYLSEAKRMQKLAGIIKEGISSTKYKDGDILNFKDGEVWKVTKVTHKGVFAKPHDEKTKQHNVSLEIEMTNDYLESHLK
jgi:signal peptidase I